MRDKYQTEHEEEHNDQGFQLDEDEKRTISPNV